MRICTGLEMQMGTGLEYLWVQGEIGALWEEQDVESCGWGGAKPRWTERWL